MKHKRFANENESFEFYYGGTHNDALQVKKELKEQFNKEGVVFMNSYGWFVRVKKEDRL